MNVDTASSPVLVGRIHPDETIAEDFDRWEYEKHMAELMEGPGMLSCTYYRNEYDRLPAVLQGSGSRMALYHAEDWNGMMAWLGSQELRDAYADGGQWFGNFHSLDRATLTGNVYRPPTTINVRGAEPNVRCTLLVERLEVAKDDEEAFEDWASTTHLPALAAAEGVERVRYFKGQRENLPVSFYDAPGNRMIVTELTDEADFRSTLATPTFLGAMRDSTRWDLKCHYARRDVYSYLNHVYASRQS